jgi:hypothetical protein
VTEPISDEELAGSRAFLNEAMTYLVHPGGGIQTALQVIARLDAAEAEADRLRRALRIAISGMENMSRSDDDKAWWIEPARAALAGDAS